MKIHHIHIDGFGVWSDLSVDNLGGEMTVFFGPNEAGKTTLMQFVRAAFYGFSPERRTRYLPPVHGGAAGGHLRASGAAGTIDVRRGVDGNRADGTERFLIARPDGTPLGERHLTSLLSEIDEPTFNNVFAFGLRELQELGTLDDTAAAELLYKLTSGLDRVSLIDVMHYLAGSRQRLLPKDGRAELVELLARRDRLEKDLREVSDRSRRWLTLAEQRGSLGGEITALETSQRHLESEIQRIDLARRIEEPWLARAQVDGQLAELGPIVELPAGAIETLDQLHSELTRTRSEGEQLKRQCHHFRQRIDSVPLNRSLWAQSSRLEALVEHLPWIESLEGQAEDLRHEISRLEQELEGHADRLNLPQENLPERLPELTQNIATLLRQPARELREQTERLEQIRGESESTKDESSDLIRKLESELASRGYNDLPTALEEAGNRVAGLRRRIQLEERLDKISRHRRELEEDRYDILEEQLLPWTRIGWIGLLIVASAIVVLGALFWSNSPNYRWPIAIFGFGGLALGILMKFAIEQGADRELDECDRQLETIRRQLRQAHDERDSIDSSLSGAGSLDARLKEAEAELSRLQELAPLDHELQSAHQRREAARTRLEDATNAMRESRDRWLAALRRAGLPDNVSAKNLKDLSDGCEAMLGIVQQLAARREALESRRNDLRTIGGRVEELLSAGGISPLSSDTRARIQQLATGLVEQRDLHGKRQEMRGQYRDLRKKLGQTLRAAERLTNQRTAMFAAAGVVKEQEYRRLAARQARHHVLRDQRDDLSRQIAAALGEVGEETIAKEFELHPDGALTQRWDQLQTRAREARSRLAGLHQRRGEVQQEMKLLAEDRRLATTKMELGCVERRIAQMVDRWRVLTVASSVLEAICRKYEADRQPETLNAASSYLRQMTEGRYVRLWTPMHDSSLRIDNAEGQSLSIEVLSRGTREAVFISLRLALVAAFARRGMILPLVLDDVLVNFDARRARATARVMRDFAKEGHQVLLFTCHEHIMRLFSDEGVEIRLLPARAGAAVRLALEEAATPPPRPVEEVTDDEMDALLENDLLDDPVAKAPEETAVEEEIEAEGDEEFAAEEESTVEEYYEDEELDDEQELAPPIYEEWEDVEVEQRDGDHLGFFWESNAPWTRTRATHP